MRFAGGGVTPPFASRFAAIFCSLAISARSRFDMMPSFGGRPGPRRFGCDGSLPSGDVAPFAESPVVFVLRISLVTLRWSVPS